MLPALAAAASAASMPARARAGGKLAPSQACNSEQMCQARMHVMPHGLSNGRRPTAPAATGGVYPPFLHESPLSQRPQQLRKVNWLQVCSFVQRMSQQ
jgi:hypothetical protein